MKKNYINPRTDIHPLSVEKQFLASQKSVATGANVSFDNESDFDSYFNNN